MPRMALNGTPIMEASVTLHRTGCPVAEVSTTDPVVPEIAAGSAVKLELDGLTLVGTALTVGDFNGLTRVLMVGGAGGLGLAAAPASYSKAPFSQIVQGLLSGAGETLSGTVAPSTLSAAPELWSVRAETVSAALTAIAGAAGCVWRVLVDGTVWFGVDTYPAADLTDATLMAYDPGLGQATIGITSPELVPGRSISIQGVSGNVSTVDYRIRTEGYRMMVLFEDATQVALDRQLSPWAAIIGNFVAPTKCYGTYGATVASQSSNLTKLDIIPDDKAKFGGMSDVPIRLGVPGVTANVAYGARCSFTFLNGDPGKAIVTGFDDSAIDKNTPAVTLTFTGFTPTTPGPQPVARVGDKVRILASDIAGLALVAGMFPVTASVPANHIDVAITSGNPHLLA